MRNIDLKKVAEIKKLEERFGVDAVYADYYDLREAMGKLSREYSSIMLSEMATKIKMRAESISSIFAEHSINILRRINEDK